MATITKQEQKNRFAILNVINCNDHTEKKNGLTYLSWSWAWTELKKLFPDSYYTVYERPDGCIYWHDDHTCWVKTGVTLVDGDYQLEHIEYLPIMDFKNKSIPLSSVDSMAVNKAIQRSLTKAIARHGLGCYIYAGEDLPEESEEDKAARAAAEKKAAEELKSVKSSIDVLAKKLAAASSDQVGFFNKYVVPVIGQMNYNNCNELDKLNQLLENLKKLDSAGKKKAA